VSMWTIGLQCRRLRSAEPEDQEFLFRKWADFDFLIVALTRLRRAGKLASEIPETREVMVLALVDFDSALPQLKKFRNIAEHLDEYAIDLGNNKSVRREALEVSSLSADGTVLEWLGHKLNADDALLASRILFDAIKKAGSVFARGA